MQNRNATDKLNQQCSKLALVANTIIEICGKMTMLVYYIIDLAYHLHFYLQVTTNLQSSVLEWLERFKFPVVVFFFAGMGSQGCC